MQRGAGLNALAISLKLYCGGQRKVKEELLSQTWTLTHSVFKFALPARFLCSERRACHANETHVINLSAQGA